MLKIYSDPFVTLKFENCNPLDDISIVKTIPLSQKNSNFEIDALFHYLFSEGKIAPISKLECFTE